MSLLINAFASRLRAAPLLLLVLATMSWNPSVMASPLTATAPSVAKADPVVKILNADQVYYPTRTKKGAKYKKPAVLTTSTIFNSISEWKEIKKKKLTEKDAEYHLLLKKANEKFDCALTTVRKSGSYDIIAEVGAISCKNCTASDITQNVVAALP